MSGDLCFEVALTSIFMCLLEAKSGRAEVIGPDHRSNTSSQPSLPRFIMSGDLCFEVALTAGVPCFEVALVAGDVEFGLHDMHGVGIIKLITASPSFVGLL
jgi:hypothetical protein